MQRGMFVMPVRLITRNTRRAGRIQEKQERECTYAKLLHLCLSQLSAPPNLSRYRHQFLPGRDRLASHDGSIGKRSHLSKKYRRCRLLPEPDDPLKASGDTRKQTSDTTVEIVHPPPNIQHPLSLAEKLPPGDTLVKLGELATLGGAITAASETHVDQPLSAQSLCGWSSGAATTAGTPWRSIGICPQSCCTILGARMSCAAGRRATRRATDGNGRRQACKQTTDGIEMGEKVG